MINGASAPFFMSRILSQELLAAKFTVQYNSKHLINIAFYKYKSNLNQKSPFTVLKYFLNRTVLFVMNT